MVQAGERTGTLPGSYLLSRRPRYGSLAAGTSVRRRPAMSFELRILKAALPSALLERPFRPHREELHRL
jgi:hypothetical protein